MSSGCHFKEAVRPKTFSWVASAVQSSILAPQASGPVVDRVPLVSRPIRSSPENSTVDHSFSTDRRMSACTVERHTFDLKEELPQFSASARYNNSAIGGTATTPPSGYPKSSGGYPSSGTPLTPIDVIRSPNTPRQIPQLLSLPLHLENVVIQSPNSSTIKLPNNNIASPKITPTLLRPAARKRSVDTGDSIALPPPPASAPARGEGISSCRCCCRRTAATSTNQPCNSNIDLMEPNMLGKPLEDTAFAETVRYMKYRAFLRWYLGAHEAAWSRSSCSFFCLVAGSLILFSHYSLCNTYMIKRSILGIGIGAMLFCCLLLLFSNTLFLLRWTIRASWFYILVGIVILLVVNTTNIGHRSTLLTAKQCDAVFWLPVSYLAVQGLLIASALIYGLIVGRAARFYFLHSRLFMKGWRVTHCERVQLLVPAIGEASKLRYQALLGRPRCNSTVGTAAAPDRLRVSWGLRIEAVSETTLSHVFCCRRRKYWVGEAGSPNAPKHVGCGCYRARRGLRANVVSYIGETGIDQKPDGFGFWRERNSELGERLVGYWTQGIPNGPHKSREVGTGSGFMCLRIGWAKFAGDSTLKFGVANVECSVSGRFYRGYPRVKLMWPGEVNNPLGAIGRLLLDWGGGNNQPTTTAGEARKVDAVLYGGRLASAIGPYSQQPGSASARVAIPSQREGAMVPHSIIQPPPRSKSATAACELNDMNSMDQGPVAGGLARLKRTAMAVPRAAGATLLKRIRNKDIEKLARLSRARRDVAWCLAELSPHTPNFGIQPRSELVITVDAERGVYISGYLPKSNVIPTIDEEALDVVDDATLPGNATTTGPSPNSTLPTQPAGDTDAQNNNSSNIIQPPLRLPSTIQNRSSPRGNQGRWSPLSRIFHRSSEGFDNSSFNLRESTTAEGSQAPPQQEEAPHQPFYRKPTVEKEVHRSDVDQVCVRVVKRKLLSSSDPPPLPGAALSPNADCPCLCHIAQDRQETTCSQPATEAGSFVYPDPRENFMQPTTGGSTGLEGEIESPELQADGWVSMDAAGSPEVLLYIHGYNNSHEESLQVLGQMAAFGNYPNHIRLFLFSWPAGSGFWQFFKARKAAEDPRTHQALADLLRALRDNGIRQVHIMCHSMGARLFLRSFRKAAASLFFKVDGASPRKGKMQLVSVTFLNPEYYLSEFVAEDYSHLRSFCTHISIFADAGDQALWWSETLSRKPALGKTVFGLWRFRDNAEQPLLSETDQQQQLVCKNPPKFMNTVSFFHINGHGNNNASASSSTSALAAAAADESVVEWLDLDVIDTTFMDQNVHAMRHTFWNLNREIIEDIRELMVTRKRARQRIGRLDRRERNVWVYRVAPSFLTSLWDISI